VTCFAKQVPYFIGKAICEIAEERKEKFSVLIIAPTNARCRKVAQSLKDKGFDNVQYVVGEKNNELTLMDALTLLAENAKCNLGWRIAAKLFLTDGDFKGLLEKAHGGEGNGFYELIDGAVREKINLLLAAFKKVAKGQTANLEQFAQLLHELGLDPQVLAHEVMRTKIETYAGPKGSDPATRNISIKITTIPSSKGLAEDYVFIADFDDRFFLEKEKKCSDQKIFDFLVALTRARRKVFLISAEPKEPKFLTWIAKGRIEKTKL
jgi:superfamily I DNA/RNA helicase